ncbi:MAG TPA: VOC family protein [Nitrospiraceae bacterium]|nr:VOC family protein [Nitrospiraceae bacterium]
MQIKDLYAIVVTEKRVQSRDFYVRWFGFQVVFEASWFVYLAAAGEHPFGIAFMSPDHPSQPPGPDVFSGKGMFLTLQVEDAAAEFERLRRAGLTIAHLLHDEPWGQRRFAVYDHSGMWVDVVQQIEPAPGFWDRYVSPESTTAQE